MKRFLILAAIAFIPMALSAQDDKDHNSWKEKMMSEKIAFLTAEVGFTPEEAQAFWPVYNAAWEELDQARHKIMRSYRALSEGIKAGKSEKETEALLGAYIAALGEANAIEASLCERYRKVLSGTKVAKLYVAEEQFRRQQIHKLHHHPAPKK